MYEKFIEDSLTSLKESDIKNYAKREGISLSNEETKIIDQFIRKYYKELLKEEGLQTLQKLKSVLSIPLYQEIEKKYITTKNKFFN